MNFFVKTFLHKPGDALALFIAVVMVTLVVLFFLMVSKSTGKKPNVVEIPRDEIVTGIAYSDGQLRILTIEKNKDFSNILLIRDAKGEVVTALRQR